MTSQRHLKELLREDQEPFHLTNYIAEKKWVLKKQACVKQQQISPHRAQNELQVKKKPKQNASFPSHFCKNACFLSSFQVDSPDYRKSPLLSPAWGNKSPSRAIFLHVPAKTAALLVEAACRIQKNSSGSATKPKPNTHIKNSGFGLLGSVIKRLTNRTRTRTRTRKLQAGDSAQTDDDVIRWADSVKTSSSRRSGVSRRDEIRVGSDAGSLEKSDLVEDQTGFLNSRLSSVWSEENKSLASSSSSTSCSRSASGNLSEEEGEDKIGFVNVLDKENAANINEDFTFCLSPLSPFRFALQKSPSPGRRSPAFCSPAASPSRRRFQECVNFEQQNPSVKFQEQDEEEEKEQCSPVSILDPPFGDDDCEEEGESREDEDNFDMECSYAFVQRTKQHLLQKLRKFEKLAELDPIELEKRMMEEEDDDDDDEEEEEEEEEDKVGEDLSTSLYDERNTEGCLIDIARKSGFMQDLVNPGMKRLLLDLISEEKICESNYESLIKRVCMRLESWNEVEPNTIEMMVAMDLKGECGMWRNPREEVSQTAKLAELSVYGMLLEELLDELIMS